MKKCEVKSGSKASNYCGTKKQVAKMQKEDKKQDMKTVKAEVKKYMRR
jgi:hypothetical protein